MPVFDQQAVAIGQDGFTPTTTQMAPLGSRAYTRDGRVFRYCQMGGVDGVAGSVYQSAAPIGAHLANTPPVLPIGTTSFLYTPGAANLYAEGFMQVDTAPGNGYTYRVLGHGAITSSVAFTLYLDPTDPIQVALTASSRVGLIHNPFRNVIVTPTTQTATVVGVCPCVIPTTQYGWLQVWGPASVLVNGTPAITAPVVNSATTIGGVDGWVTAAAAVGVQPIGHMMQVGVSGKNNFVFLEIS